jgi:hypothetical protein
MYKEVVKVDKPEILLITPLRIKDNISSLTEKSIMKNNTSFD